MLVLAPAVQHFQALSKQTLLWTISVEEKESTKKVVFPQDQENNHEDSSFDEKSTNLTHIGYNAQHHCVHHQPMLQKSNCSQKASTGSTMPRTTTITHLYMPWYS